MASRKTYLAQIVLLGLTIFIMRIESKHFEAEKKKHKKQSHKSKLNTDKENVWPFLPNAGSRNGKRYPFMILAPPGREKESEEKLHDASGSKYFLSTRQPVPFSQQNVVSYIPVFYTAPQYQPVYIYQPLTSQNYNYVDENHVFSGSPVFGYANLRGQTPFLFTKRSKSKKPTSHDKNEPMNRQFLPRHHWAFSQWPFDSHEYAFTKSPLHSSNAPHLPRWGPVEWGGAGPGRHWAVNREGLPSPFGIGLAPLMGGQGYIGLEGHWPAGHGYPFDTNFPKSPHLQHLLH